MFVTPMPSDNSMPSSPESTQPPCSGLSALIHAATSQLEYLAEVASTQFIQSDDVEETQSTQEFTLNQRQETVSPMDDPASFPVQLMNLCCRQPEYQNTITFLPNGKFFAIRQSLFLQEQLLDSLQSCEEDINTFADFVSHLQEWGFRRMDATQNGGSNVLLPEVLVFRHAQFIEGDYVQCRQIVRGENAKVANTSTMQASKRRLSPGFLQEQDHENGGSKVQVVVDRSNACSTTTDAIVPTSERIVSSASGESDTTGETSCPDAPLPPPNKEELRTMASSIAAEKMKLSNNSSNDSSLIETAVTSCTYEIVTSAIECLLRDKTHSQVIYQKHEEELSRSSLPGLVPVCKHLFAAASSDTPAVVRVVTIGSSDTTSEEPPHAVEEPPIALHQEEV
jgi:HSF-type DNA-binding